MVLKVFLNTKNNKKELNMLNLPGFEQPKFMDALNIANKVTNIREISVTLPIMGETISVTPMEGIDDLHLKTLFGNSTHFLKTFNQLLYKHINHKGLFEDLDDFNKRITEYDKRLIVYALITSSFDTLPERTLTCPMCGNKDIHDLDPELMLQQDSLEQTWDKEINYLDFREEVVIVPMSEETDENGDYTGNQISIFYKIPTEQDKIDLMELVNVNKRKIDENNGELLTTLEYFITYIDRIEIKQHDQRKKDNEGNITEGVVAGKKIILNDIATEIFPFVTKCNLIIQDKIVKTTPVEKFEKYQPKFYFNMQCLNSACSHKYKYDVGNIENEFFRKALSIYK